MKPNLLFLSAGVISLALSVIAGAAARAVDPVPPAGANGPDAAKAPEPAPAEPGAGSRITDISFKGTSDPNQLEIISSGPVSVDKQVNRQDKQIILTIPGATLAKGRNRKIDASSFNGNITLISPYQSEDGTVRIVVQLRHDGDGAIIQDGNRIKLSVPMSADQLSMHAAAPMLAPPTAPMGPSMGTLTGAMGAPGASMPPADPVAATPGTDAAAAEAATPVAKPKDSMDQFLANSQTKVFNGKPIKSQVRDVDVEDVFRLISEASGFNIILGQDVTGKLTLSLSEVPWDQALDVVLQTMHLGADRHGNVLRVVTLSNLALEKTLELRARQASEAIVPKIERVYPISYADIKALKTAILDMAASDASSPIQQNAALAQLNAQAQAANPQGAAGANASPNGQNKNPASDVTVIADDRTNSLVVRAIPSTMSWIKKMIELLDTQTPQVLIEGKVIEATENFSRNIGGGLAGNDKPGNPAGAFSISNNLAQAVDPLLSAPTGTQLLSSTLLASPTGAFAMNFGPIDGRRIAAMLNIAEAESQIKVVSSPKTTVMNKQQAKVVQGTPVIVPVLTVTQYGPQTMQTVVQANLSLTVTPTVTSDGSVLMDLELDKDTVETAAGSTAGAKAVAPRSIKTNVLVENGSTLVLGGFYVSDEEASSGGIPWLRDIPILGTFFGSKSKLSVHDELFFFITPRILNPKKAGLTASNNG